VNVARDVAVGSISSDQLGLKTATPVAAVNDDVMSNRHRYFKTVYHP